MFLAEFAQRGIVTRAARAAGTDRTNVYLWCDHDPAFALAFDDAKEQATDSMEDEARRRAVDGVDKPVYQGGILVGYIHEYSDSLLTTMLKANRPEKFRDRFEVMGKDGGPIQHERIESVPTAELVAEAEALLRDAAREQGSTG
jgi:hypothetical protein